MISSRRLGVGAVGLILSCQRILCLDKLARGTATFASAAVRLRSRR